MSTNSDPNDAQQQSLLARITAKRKEENAGSNAATPTATSVMENGNFQFGQKPPTGVLRVDTTVAGDAVTAAKQNKSAYPTFANSTPQALSPGPATAGPEFVSRPFGQRPGVHDLSQVRISTLILLYICLLIDPSAYEQRGKSNCELSSFLYGI